MNSRVKYIILLELQNMIKKIELMELDAKFNPTHKNFSIVAPIQFTNNFVNFIYFFTLFNFSSDEILIMSSLKLYIC